MKILVVGFPRSGTSLTYRIFKNHPQVKQMYFEQWVIKKPKTKEEFLNRYPLFRKSTCGEKVICEKRVTGKIGKTNQTIVDYCLKWNDWFEDEAKIIQIVRHPIDALNSLVISKQKFPRGPVFNFVYKEYLEYIPNYLFRISKISNCKTIKYEDLLSNPKKIINDLYEYCNLKSYNFQERIKKEKAFKYLNQKKLLFEYNDLLELATETLNKIPGAKYEL